MKVELKQSSNGYRLEPMSLSNEIRQKKTKRNLFSNKDKIKLSELSFMLYNPSSIYYIVET